MFQTRPFNIFSPKFFPERLLVREPDGLASLTTRKTSMSTPHLITTTPKQTRSFHMLPALLLAGSLASTNTVAHAADWGDAAKLGGAIAGVVVVAKTLGTISENQAEQQRLAQEQARENERTKRLEQDRQAALAQEQKDAEYQQWFASLSHEQQTQEVLRQQELQRTQSAVKHGVVQTGAELLGHMAGPKVYEINN
jgi:Skp family chaperone for outer membrane proteins